MVIAHPCPKSKSSTIITCELHVPSIRASMSKRLFIALQPSTQCSIHHVRRYAPQAYLFQSDNLPYPSKRPHTRPFSASTRCAAAGQTRQIKASQGSQPSQPSISVQRSRAMQKAMRDGEIPEDLGVLPQTFIMPFGSKRPGWIANWKGRLRLERARWWARVQDIGSCVYSKRAPSQPRSKTADLQRLVTSCSGATSGAPIRRPGKPPP